MSQPRPHQRRRHRAAVLLHRKQRCHACVPVSHASPPVANAPCRPARIHRYTTRCCARVCLCGCALQSMHEPSYPPAATHHCKAYDKQVTHTIQSRLQGRKPSTPPNRSALKYTMCTHARAHNPHNGRHTHPQARDAEQGHASALTCQTGRVHMAWPAAGVCGVQGHARHTARGLRLRERDGEGRVRR